jgi:predicted MFS family arabinose efflux permease
VLAVTAYAGYATVPIVLAVSLCLGSLNVFTTAAQMAMVPSLVSRRDVPQAVALNSITFNLARALGPPFAALVIVAFGTATAFAMNSISFVVFTIGLLLVTPAKQPRAHRATLRESVVAMRAQPRLVMHLAVVITVSFVSDPVNTEGAAIAHSFGLSPVWTGALIGFFGMGAVSAGVLVGGREAPPARIACTLGVMGCGMVGLGVSPWFGLALLLAGVAGFGYLSSNAAATSQLQLGVDDAMRGRIMALWSVGFLGARPVASLIDGALAGAFGVRAATVVMATPAFALGTAMLLFSRSHHQSGTPLVRES